MAKSSRASSRKTNNQRLKKNVFAPVEAARAERLSAKLQDLVTQEKPQKEADVNMGASDVNVTRQITDEDSAQASEGLYAASGMDLDTAGTSVGAKRTNSGKIEKRKKRTKSNIVFPKYNSRKGKK